jgi:hypothetical protein
MAKAIVLKKAQELEHAVRELRKLNRAGRATMNKIMEAARQVKKQSRITNK